MSPAEVIIIAVLHSILVLLAILLSCHLDRQLGREGSREEHGQHAHIVILHDAHSGNDGLEEPGVRPAPGQQIFLQEQALIEKILHVLETRLQKIESLIAELKEEWRLTSSTRTRRQTGEDSGTNSEETKRDAFEEYMATIPKETATMLDGRGIVAQQARGGM